MSSFVHGEDVILTVERRGGSRNGKRQAIVFIAESEGECRIHCQLWEQHITKTQSRVCLV